MSKSNYSSSHRSPTHYSSSHRSSSHESRHLHLHSHDTIYSPGPSRTHGSQHLTTNDNDENDQFRKQYPPLEVPTSMYKVVFVNKNTSMEEMNLLINHTQSCKQFTIDTESERSNGQLALIQIQTLPPRLPTFVILIELAQLPTEDSHMYVKIKKFFDLVFRLGNELYSWGNMEQELRPITDYNLIKWPLLPLMIDIQPHYGSWYERARILRESSCPKHFSHDANVDNDNPAKCECYKKSPYRQGQAWSLQKALIYSKHLFIDKSIRMNNWAGGLTNKDTKLSSSRRKNMINYAVNDVLATTMLIRPILEDWSLEMVQKIKIEDLYVQFKSIPPPQLPQKTKKIKKNINTQKFISALFGDNDLEPISDDEIYCSQIIEPTINNNLLNDVEPTDDNYIPINNNLLNDVEPTDDNYIPIDNNLLNDNELIVNNHYMVDDVDDKEETTPTNKRKKNRQRSAQARNRKNHRRNTKLKKKRFYYSIKRNWYPRFSMFMIRKILRLYNINYKHVRDDGDGVLIGLKDRRSRITAEHQLPWNIFNRQSYLHYRKKFRC